MSDANTARAHPHDGPSPETQRTRNQFMKVGLITLALAAAIPFAANAVELSYNYLQAGYTLFNTNPDAEGPTLTGRSDEPRVGTPSVRACRSRSSQYH